MNEIRNVRLPKLPLEEKEGEQQGTTEAPLFVGGGGGGRDEEGVEVLVWCRATERRLLPLLLQIVVVVQRK